MQEKQSVNYQERGKAANRLLSTTQGATKRVPYVYRDVRMCASVFVEGMPIALLVTPHGT